MLEAAATQVSGRDAKLGAQVFLKGFGGGLVMWQVRVWCAPAAYFASSTTAKPPPVS